LSYRCLTCLPGSAESSRRRGCPLSEEDHSDFHRSCANVLLYLSLRDAGLGKSCVTGSLTAALARWSAISFPWMLLWPGTHCRRKFSRYSLARSTDWVIRFTMLCPDLFDGSSSAWSADLLSLRMVHIQGP
jgi:hypothetical protein